MKRKNLSRLAPLDTIWLAEESHFNQAWRVLQAWDGVGFSMDFMGDEGESNHSYTVADGVAVLSLTGPMTKEPHCMQMFFGGTSTRMMREQLEQVVSDSSVRAIVLRIDSPGGMSAGTADLADDVKRASAKKPVYGYCEDLCASAAYWVGSQCTALYANRTALVGSIGTYMVIEDTSRAAENAGVKVHVVKAGTMKGAAVDGTQVTDTQLADFRRTVKQLNSEFVRSVTHGRNLTADQAEDIADGRVHIASVAHQMGLVDGVASLPEVVRLALNASRGQTNISAVQAGHGQPDSINSSGNQENNRMDEKNQKKKNWLASFFSKVSDEALSEIPDEVIETQTATTGNATVTGTIDFTKTDAFKQMQDQINTLTSTVQAQSNLIQSQADEMAKARAKSEREGALARVEKAIEAGFITPAKRTKYQELADKNIDAFNAAMDAIEDGEPLPAFNRTIDASSVVDGGGDALAALDTKAKEIMKVEGVQYHEAFKKASSQLPSEAAQYRREQEKLARANSTGE